MLHTTTLVYSVKPNPETLLLSPADDLLAAVLLGMPVDAERMRRIDAEFAHHGARVAREVLDDHHATLY